MAAYVLFGQPGYRGMVRPHALWPISSEVGYDGLLAVAHHDGEVVAVRLGLGLRRHPHRGPLGQVRGGPTADEQIERDAAFGGSP
jgi:hypothetical protein